MLLEMNQHYGDWGKKKIFCGQNIETRYYRADTDYHNLHAIMQVTMLNTSQNY